MSEIFTLSIACVSGMYLTEDYSFVQNVSTDYTLGELASDILAMAKFDGDHMAEFYVANGPRGKKTRLTADGEWDGDDSAMWELPLSGIFPLAKHKKLFYIYDFGASWIFEIRKKGKATLPVAGLKYPYLVSEEGTRPVEYGDPDGDSW